MSALLLARGLLLLEGYGEGGSPLITPLHFSCMGSPSNYPPALFLDGGPLLSPLHSSWIGGPSDDHLPALLLNGGPF